MPTRAALGSAGARPPFDAPWQAQVFALVVTLLERGVVTDDEWARALGTAIARAQDGGDPDLGDTYYEHWLSALESLTVGRRLLSAGDLRERKAAWAQAHASTPHGEPVVLESRPDGGHG